MSPEPAIDPGQKPPSRPLWHFEGSQEPGSRPRGISREATTVCVTDAGRGQAYLVAAGAGGTLPPRAPRQPTRRLPGSLRNGHLHILHERVFGSSAVWPTVRSVRRRVLQSQGLEADGPLTYVQGQPPWGKGLSGSSSGRSKSASPATGSGPSGTAAGRWAGVGSAMAIPLSSCKISRD